MRQIERIPCELIQRSDLLISHRDRLRPGHDRVRREAVRLKFDRAVLEFDILDHVRRDLDRRIVGDDRGGVVFVGGVDYGGGGVACVAVAAIAACAAVSVAAVISVAGCAVISGSTCCLGSSAYSFSCSALLTLIICAARACVSVFAAGAAATTGNHSGQKLVCSVFIFLCEVDDLCFGGDFVVHIHVRELDPHVHRRRDHQLVPVLVDELDVQNPQEGLAALLQVQGFFDLRGVLLKSRLVPFAHRGSCPARQNLVDLQLHAHRQLRFPVKSHIDLISLLFIFINKLSFFVDQRGAFDDLIGFFRRRGQRSLAFGRCFALCSGCCQAFIACAFASSCCTFASACSFCALCAFAGACACSGRAGAFTGAIRIIVHSGIVSVAAIAIIGIAVVGTTIVGVSITIVSVISIIVSGISVIVASGTGVFSTAGIIS